MSELGRFQQAFGEALAGDFAALAPWTGGEGGEARFAVHRNTVARGCAEALADQFPTVRRALGEARMAAAALAFSRGHPPVSPSLMAYGDGFPGWLASFPPAADMPWLAGLARIDWARRDVLFAADGAPIGPEAFAALAPEAYATTAAELHPAMALLRFEDATPSLWRTLQADEAPAEIELAAEPEGLLLLRPGLEVVHRVLGAGAYAFLAACRQGLSLAAAGERALIAQPGLPLRETFADLIAAGAFVCVRPAGALVP